MSTSHLAHRAPEPARLVARWVVANVPDERDGNMPVLAQGRIGDAALSSHPLTKPRHQLRRYDLLHGYRNDARGTQVLHEYLCP
jgi:hypothetical protein